MRIKKSKSKKVKEEKPKLSQGEFEEKVIELAKKGLTAEKIGEELKRQNIHTMEFKKRISQILKEKNIYINPDIKNIEKKLEKIKKHQEKSKQDKRAMREGERIFAHLKKLEGYFGNR